MICVRFYPLLPVMVFRRRSRMIRVDGPKYLFKVVDQARFDYWMDNDKFDWREHK